MRRRDGNDVRGSGGFTTLELVFALGVASVLAGASIGGIREWQAHSRGMTAARVLLTEVRMARTLAIREGAYVGLVFRDTPDGIAVRLHRDGNGNGLRNAEIDAGLDQPLGNPLVVADLFPGARFALPRTVPGIDGGATLLAGSDPVRLSGGGRLLSCSPAGAVTAGTMYLAGPRGTMFAVRVLGPTGRLRLFEFDSAARGWRERW